ncbi:MAG: NAD(P)-dependent glycerol-3-phosphate dehydrogenase [Gammaproteobacteria bacterium]
MPPRAVSVIGAGSWGTALAMLLARNIDNVRLWGRDPQHLAEMAQRRVNRRYLPDIPFPPNLAVEADLAALPDAGLDFVVALPSRALRETLGALRRIIAAAGREPLEATIIWGSKGFESGGRLPGEVVAEVFDGGGAPGGARAVVSGPSFALETAQSLPTALTLACAERARAQSLAQWFRTPTTRVYFSDDMLGVQLGGAVKNVLAIAVGISDGLGHGANARAALITRGLAEMTRLGTALGGRADTFTGLAGVGDLILTCTDDQSRNRRLGLGIGGGASPQSVCAGIGQEIEGLHTARELHALSRRHRVEMPISEQVYRVLHRGHDPKLAVRALLQRDPKAEA